MTVSLNITAGAVKVLRLHRGRVRKWGSASLEPGWVGDGLVRCPEEVGAVIASLTGSLHLSGERVAVSVAGLSFVYRFITLPRLQPARFDEAVVRAVKDEISIPPEELNLAWQTLPGTGDEVTIFALGVPKAQTEPVATALRLAHIRPLFMEPRPLALARAAGVRNGIAVNADADTVDIVFLRDGVTTVVHTIRPRGPGATLADNARRIADEIAKMTAFYGEEHTSEETGPVTLYLAGDLAADVTAPALFSAETGYAVELLAPPVTAPDDFPGHQYGINIGLALRGGGRGVSGTSGFALNVLADQRPRRRERTSRPALLLVAGIVALALLAWPLHLVTANLRTTAADLHDRQTELERQATLIGLAAADAADTEKEIAVALARAAALRDAADTIRQRRGITTGRLDALEAARPAGVAITRYDIRAGAVLVRGAAAAADDVVAFASALQAAGVFNDVRIAFLDEPADGGATFELAVTP
jgi:hypothetical protein